LWDLEHLSLPLFVSLSVYFFFSDLSMVLFSQRVVWGQWKTNLSPTGSWDRRAGGIDREEVKQKVSEQEVKWEIEGEWVRM